MNQEVLIVLRVDDIKHLVPLLKNQLWQGATVHKTTAGIPLLTE